MLTGQCNTCNSEDCNCVCHICNKNQPKTGSAIIRNTRSRKQNKIDWISCNKCEQWVNPQRSGINKKEITKINQCIKANKAGPFFKCLKCSILPAKTFGINIIQLIRQSPNQCPVNLKQKTISHTPQQQLINQNKFTHHQTNHQWHQQTKTQIGHHHREVTVVTQKTHLHPEKISVCQRTSKTPAQA